MRLEPQSTINLQLEPTVAAPRGRWRVDPAGIGTLLTGAAAVIGALAQLVKELRRRSSGPGKDSDEARGSGSQP
jgi:hypothetical protein